MYRDFAKEKDKQPENDKKQDKNPIKKRELTNDLEVDSFGKLEQESPVISFREK